MGLDRNFIFTTSGENSLILNHNGSVDLYYDGSKKFETTGYGVTVFGTTDTQQLISSGISTFITGIAFLQVHKQLDLRMIASKFLNLETLILVVGNSSGKCDDVFIKSYNGRNLLRTNTANVVQGGIKLFYSGSSSSVERLETTNTGVTITGTVVGTVFTGDGSHLVDGKWTLSADGSSDYTFTGIGFTQTTNDPILYLARGRVYEFVNTMGSHPFEIRESAGGSLR